jgi:hypothetical protein
MKTIARVHPTRRLSHGASRSPAQPKGDRAWDFSFYFLIGTLVLGLIYFIVLGVWLTF